MIEKNYSVFLGCESSFEDARTVIFGAPFDSTTSNRPGTRFASKVIRNESFGIETYSPLQDKDLTDIAVCDSGDLELCFGDTNKALDGIEQRAEEILSAGKRPLMIGGEHLVTLGAVRAAARKYPDLCILHLDAHADLRNDYLGAELSHATVIRRCHDIIGDGRIYQFGIRSGEKSEFEFASSHTHMTKFTLDGFSEALDALRGKPVYFTIDLDVVDPSEFPATGTPEAGGISYTMLADVIVKAGSALDIVAMDVNELSPPYDPSGISAALACKVVRELLLAVNK